jgi:hypothetical protein
MGWERRGGRSYYYRKERVGGRVVSRYIGAGSLGELWAALDENDRDLREYDREKRQDERRPLDDLDAAAETAFGQAMAIGEAAMIAAGYHRHKGTWRKRREQANHPGPDRDSAGTALGGCYDCPPEESRDRG